MKSDLLFFFQDANSARNSGPKFSKSYSYPERNKHVRKNIDEDTEKKTLKPSTKFGMESPTGRIMWKYCLLFS